MLCVFFVPTDASSFRYDCRICGTQCGLAELDSCRHKGAEGMSPLSVPNHGLVSYYPVLRKVQACTPLSNTSFSKGCKNCLLRASVVCVDALHIAGASSRDEGRFRANSPSCD